MATGFNTQIIDGRFHLQFETDKREYYEYVQAAARDCLDGKATDKCHRWISVEERLPESDDNMLVIVNGECKTMTFEEAYMLASYYPGEGWIVEGYEEWENPVVTHWMPLPEPPEVTKP